MEETAGNEPVSTHDAGESCQCVKYHTPKVTHVHRHHVLPLSWGGGNEQSNLEWLCPTTHEHVHILLRAYKQYEGNPPYSLKRQFNPYVQTLARDGWNAYLDSQQ